MAVNRVEITLGDLGRIVTGKTPLTSIPDNFGGSIPFVTPTDMDGRKTIDSTLRFLTEKGAASVKGSRIPRGSVMVSCIGSDMGKVAIAGRECVTNQQINSIVVKEGFCSEFIYYCLSTRKAELQHIASGAAQPILNKRHFSELGISLPPLPEQKAIAWVLGTLDDKIELNRRMNATLEALARALFKSWFVDFDPVHAKQEGRTPTGLDEPTAALFPDSFQDSELGPVPKGWEVQTLGELIELDYGKPLKAENRNGGNIAVYGSNGIVGWHDEKLISGPGIVIGRKGNPGFVTWSHGDFFPIDTTFYVVPNGDCRSLYFLHYALLFHDLASLSADSAVPGLNRNHVYMSKQLLPSQPLLATFDRNIGHLFAAINANEHQSRTLTTLRDTLLPKLLSGEVQIATE